MPDANESIVAKYFELNDYLVKTNLKYTIIHRGISGESDIDLVIYNPENNDRAIVEVKGWHTIAITPSILKSRDRYLGTLFYFVREEALEAARKFFKSNDFRKILVISKLGEKSKEETIKIAKEKGIDEILEFKDILNFVIEKTQENKNYADEFQQTIRLLIIYQFLKKE